MSSDHRTKVVRWWTSNNLTFMIYCENIVDVALLFLWRERRVKIWFESSFCVSVCVLYWNWKTKNQHAIKLTSTIQLGRAAFSEGKKQEKDLWFRFPSNQSKGHWNQTPCSIHHIHLHFRAQFIKTTFLVNGTPLLSKTHLGLH